MKTIITIMLAFIISAASGQTTEHELIFELEDGWSGLNITSTKSGDIHIYQSIGLNTTCIMSSHNGAIKITDTLATINELIKSYVLLDRMLKQTLRDYNKQIQRNNEVNNDIQEIIKQGRSKLKKMVLYKSH